MTTYKIGDLVKIDDRATFRNDVQLDNFDDPQLNLGLINSYLFSSALPGGRQSGQSQSIAPVGVLEDLVQAFLSDRLDNRFYLIATYGHGKSHLALALANYFSHSFDSPEVTTLLNKLNNSLGSAVKGSRYRDFKQSRGEFLVLRLRGDVPYSLHEQLLRGLEKALGEHAATRDHKLPFWFTEAERIIRGFSPTEQEKGNLYLESIGYDISLLLHRLEGREDVHDLCVKLIQHVSGIRPHLGGEISLAKVIHWVTDKFCGAGKPLGGLLILFDEFSLFVQRYAQRNATGELQDLLNGISDRQGKAAFLAFSQLDLMQLADNLMITGNIREGLKRELTRIPKKWVLFSLMESVVDAYLIQEEKPWHALLADKKISGTLYQATDVAWERFSKRYSTALQWSFEQYQEYVAKGCFPLHPITTYLLCNLKLQSDDAGTPRTVLGFVLEELRTRQDEPVVGNNGPNWILPIELVSYFEGRLVGDVYAQYAAAQRTIGEDAAQEQQAILKALLLQFLAEVAARRDDQILFLAHSAGLEERIAKQALRALSDSNVIRYDHSYKLYTFWPASNQPKILEEIIQKKLEQFSWSMRMLEELNKTLETMPGSYFGSVDVKVTWGHPTDWAARENIVTVDLLPEWLKTVPKQFSYNHRDITDGDRGRVIWIVANHDDEAISVREQVTQAFQTTFVNMSQNPPAIVAIISSRAQPELLNMFRRRWGLHQFSQKERTDAGKEMYEAEIKQADVNLFRALKMIRSDDKLPAEMARPRDVYVLPTAYVSELRTTERVSLRDLLTRLYLTVFTYAPNEFFTQYRVTSKGVNKLRDATREVAETLIQNAPSDLTTLTRVNRGIVPDLCNKFLVQKWELLTPDYRIQQQPGTRRLREAWHYIDKAIKPGNNEHKLRDILFPLLNPPYGYDYNTALLLFAAWFGYHRLDLEISVNGRRVEFSTLLTVVGKGSREFFYSIGVTDIIALRRRLMPDATEIKKRIQDAGQQAYQYEIAENELVILREIAEDERYNSDIRTGALEAAKTLTQAIGLAKQYDAEAAQIKTAIGRANTSQELITLQKKLERLPTPGNVKIQSDSPVVLREQIENRFVTVIETICRDNESPNKLTEVGLSRARLTEEKKAVASVGLPILIQRIETSLEQLKKREAELVQAIQEADRLKSRRDVIERVDPRGHLQQLLSGRVELQALNDLPDDLVQQRNTRLQQIEKAITDIHDQINQSRQTLETVTQLNQLRKIRDTLVALQPRCTDTTAATDIDALLQQAEVTQHRLEEQANRHAEIKRDILAVSDQSPLHLLMAGASRLRALTDLPTDLIRLRDERLKAIDKQIISIHTQIDRAKTDLAAKRDARTVKATRDMLLQLQTRCVETPEEIEIKQLIQQTDQLQAELKEEERRHLEWGNVIKNINPHNKRLHTLLEGRATLQALTSLPPALSQERDNRLHSVEQAIAAIQKQVERAIPLLDKATDRNQLDKYRDELLSLKQHCEETPLETTIAPHLERAINLRNFFDQLEQERKLQVDTLANSHAQVKRLQQINQDFEPFLSDTQKQLVLSQQGRLQKKVQELRGNARSWLVKQQDHVLKQNISLAQLEKHLANPPAEWAMLSSAEQQPLATLHEKVQQLINEDTATAIESRFRQITDRQTQERCIQRLQQIVSEGNS